MVHKRLETLNKIRQRDDLERMVTKVEVKKAVWDCDSDKSPGPDEDWKIQNAAFKLGCLVLKTPFIYLGTKVGENMSRKEAWKEVVDKVLSRLSKWKAKLFLSEEVGISTRWVKSVPSKMNITAWKIKTNALPMRFNLSRRGMDIDTLMCLVCKGGVETTSHLFFQCVLSKQIMRKVSSWWNVDYTDVSSDEEWRVWLVSIRIPNKLKSMMEGVFYEHPAKDVTCHHCKKVGHCKRNCHAYLAELIKKKKQVGTASSSDVFIMLALKDPIITWTLLIYDTVVLLIYDYALESATRILNMGSTKKVDKTPYELWRAVDLKEIQDEDTSPSEITSKIHMEVKGFGPPQKEVILVRRYERTHRAPTRLCLNVEVDEHSLGDLNEPASYKAAMLDSESNKWLDAMNAKMQSMKDNPV
nr:RNA-directed DNA polymerase, eukaryota [Tanacetum cinerariifolium]